LLVDIQPLDFDDDAQLRAAYDVSYRAERVGREDAPIWTHDEFVAALRSPDSGERRLAVLGLENGEVAASGVLDLFLLDNTDKGWVGVRVDPAHRRRGYGRALIEHLASAAAAAGRNQLMTDVKVPSDEVETHGYCRFATALGFEPSNVEVVRYLELPVADARIDGWLAEAAKRHQGYRIETFVDGVPGELVPSLCVLLGQLAVDAPTGAVDFEEEQVTPERFAEGLAMIKAMGRSRYETLAIAPDGVVAAQSTLVVPLDDDTDVWQWGTFVHREHRGRRLGLATKAANLRALQRARPDMRRIVTQNGETNDHMVSINATLGFEIAEASVEFVRDLVGRGRQAGAR
jgi:GNAT superfamily N-acetyltransferase